MKQITNQWLLKQLLNPRAKIPNEVKRELLLLVTDKIIQTVESRIVSKPEGKTPFVLSSDFEELFCKSNYYVRIGYSISWMVKGFSLRKAMSDEDLRMHQKSGPIPSTHSFINFIVLATDQPEVCRVECGFDFRKDKRYFTRARLYNGNTVIVNFYWRGKSVHLKVVKFGHKIPAGGIFVSFKEKT